MLTPEGTYFYHRLVLNESSLLGLKENLCLMWIYGPLLEMADALRHNSLLLRIKFTFSSSPSFREFFRNVIFLSVLREINLR